MLSSMKNHEYDSSIYTDNDKNVFYNIYLKINNKKSISIIDASYSCIWNDERLSSI